MDGYVYVRYLGSSIGARMYDCNTGYYKFGQNEHDAVNLVHETDVPRLMADNPGMFVVIPPTHRRTPLHVSLETFDGPIDEGVRQKLLQYGILSVGSILSYTEEEIADLIGLDKAEQVREAIQNYFNL